MAGTSSLVAKSTRNLNALVRRAAGSQAVTACVGSATRGVCCCRCCTWPVGSPFQQYSHGDLHTRGVIV
jgi:hypothetical protein